MAADDHIRQRMLDAALAKIVARCPFFEGRVWLAPRPPLGKKEVPGAVVLQGDEHIEYVTATGRTQRRYVDFEVLVADMFTRAGETTQLIKSLNAGAAEVEKVMVPASIDGEGLGLGEFDLVYLGTDRPSASALGDDVAEMSVKYRVAFLTEEGEPHKTTNED